MKIIKKALFVIQLLLLTACVQQRHSKTITFKLDMRHVEYAENVGIRGNFTKDRWKETVPLKDDNNDGIYETTITHETAFNNIQFKFVNLNDEFELKDADNRIINFEYKPEVISYEAVSNSEEFKIKKQ